jgi:hypothetical protein
MFLLFEQTEDFTPDQFDELDEMFQHRDKFSHLELMRRFNLTTPVGINGFYASWDDTCDALHASLGYTPVSDFHSLTQASLAASERAERARAVLFKDFVLSDIFPPGEVDPSVQLPQGTIVLDIVYQEEYVCEDGQLIHPEYTATEPDVSYVPHPVEQDECGMYTLFLVDPDAPSRIHPEMREHVMWAVMNIPQSRVGEGQCVLPYLSPCPAYASGMHRFVFALYKQKRAFDEDELFSSRDFYAQRTGIHTYEWVRERSDVLHSVPVGVEAFLSEWDSSVDAMHRAMGYLPPPQFQSPSQKRGQLSAAAAKSSSALFSPRAGEVDVITERLRKIQEAQHAFHAKVSDGSTRLSTHDQETERKARALGDGGSEEGGPVKMEWPPGGDTVGERSVSPVPKKVAPRNPVTLSSNARALTASTAASSDLSISLGEESNSAIASAALLRGNDAVMEQQTTRQEASKRDLASSHRAEHKSEQSNNVKSTTEARHQHSDGNYSEERTETVTEERSEEHSEDVFEERSEQVSGSASSQYTRAGVYDTQSSHSAEQMLREEASRTEARHQEQLQQSAARQRELEERQRQQEELREAARQAQEAKLAKQQADALERQRFQEERLREVQMQNLGQPEYRGPRKQRNSREFFSALPDSEYSDTDASSVFSGPPPNRYGYLQPQVSGSSTGPLPSVNAQRNQAPQVVPPPAPEPEETPSESDTTSERRLKRTESRESRDTSNSAGGGIGRRGAKPAASDAGSRSKQLQERIVQAKSVAQLCDLFEVSTTTIFSGGKNKPQSAVSVSTIFLALHSLFVGLLLAYF